MPAIRLHVDIDRIVEDDFAKGRKLLANIIKALPQTIGMEKLEKGEWISGWTLSVDPETLEVKPKDDSKFQMLVTMSIDEL